MVPAYSSGTLTNVLPHRNAMPQTQDMTPHSVTVYRHRADLSLCYPSMWNVTLEYTATHFNVLGKTRPGNPSLTFYTHQRTFNSEAGTVVVSRKHGTKYHTNWVINPGPVVWESITLSACPQLFPPHSDTPLIIIDLFNLWFKMQILYIVCTYFFNFLSLSITLRELMKRKFLSS